MYIYIYIYIYIRIAIIACKNCLYDVIVYIYIYIYTYILLLCIIIYCYILLEFIQKDIFLYKTSYILVCSKTFSRLPCIVDVSERNACLVNIPGRK